MDVTRDDAPLSLPPSKKTRALLAYLAVTGRAHRRDRLCGLLWDIPDDPRGALRWSLSKLRGLVDEVETRRIVADRDSVRFEPEAAEIDLLSVRRRLGKGIEALATDELALLARRFRGPFLEGLELPACPDFQAWCVAQREETARLQTRLLAALVDRLSAVPEDALAHARTWVEIDPLSQPARVALLRLLIATGRRVEAERQYDAGCRLLRELADDAADDLSAAWRDLLSCTPAEAAPPSPARHSAPPAAARAETLVGRLPERSRLAAALDDTCAQRVGRVLLLSGEPGVGKTRLLTTLMSAVRQRDGTVLDGCAYEAESGRPYGPWIDAIRRVPPAYVGQTLGGDLGLLMPELGQDGQIEPSRDRLFGAVAELVAARAHSAPPVLLVFDDVHWCDEASAALLHYVARLNRHRPVLTALAARNGELPDNAPIQRVLRGLRHDGLLDEIPLGPLTAEETAELVRTLDPAADVARVFAESAGNPLFALEVARHAPLRRDDMPRSLSGIVRDRIQGLPTDAGEVLRWAAVLGQTFSVRRLSALCPLGIDALMPALETLERHALLTEVDAGRQTGGTYAFAHDLVRRGVYTGLSEPRRRLMHWRVAEALSAAAGSDEAVAADIAFHAGLAGENATAARACIAAGRRCLRLFANAEAYALARRGMRYARRVGGPDSVELLLELTDISLTARRTTRIEETAQRIERLAEQALDHGSIEHARLGFHMVSTLRWEGGDWAGAEQHTRRAALVGRSGDPADQVLAMAETARCLAMLERDLDQAEALLLEADGLAGRAGVEPPAIACAQGMLRLHQGKLGEAADLLRHARALARRDGDRFGEFQALEQLVMLELQRRDYAAAGGLGADLVAIGEKLRDGSEAPFAHALTALARYGQGCGQALAELETALEALKLADAKHRLAFALTRAAAIDLCQGRADAARGRADEALRIARLLERPSEIALALVTSARAAAALHDAPAFRHDTAALHRIPLRGVSAHVRRAAEGLLTDAGGNP